MIAIQMTLDEERSSGGVVKERMCAGRTWREKSPRRTGGPETREDAV